MAIELMSKAWKTELGGNDKLVLLALCDFANDEGICYPSLSTLQSKAGIGKSTLTYILNAFEKIGVISRDKRKRNNNSDTSTLYHIHHFDICPEKYKEAYQEVRNYTKKPQCEHPKVHNVNTPKSPQCEHPKVHNVNTPKSPQCEHPKPQCEHPKPQCEHLEPSINRHINRQEKNIKKDSPTLIEQYKEKYETTDSFIKILEDFIAYRKTIKKPIRTTQGLRAFAKNLKDIQSKGFSISVAIETMKDNEWHTVKPSYLENTQKQQTHGGHKTKSEKRKEMFDKYNQQKQSKLIEIEDVEVVEDGRLTVGM